MSESTATQSPKRIYTERHILLSTFFLGPVAGLYFLYQNFVIIGNQSGAKKALGFGLGGTVLFITSTLITPIPAPIYRFLPWLIMFFVVYRFQKDRINNILKNGGKKQNGRKVFGIGLLCLLIFIIGSGATTMILEQLGLITIQ